MATVKSSLLEAVTWQELLEETPIVDTDFSNLHETIARGYFTTLERHLLGLQYDSIFTVMAVVGGLIVRGA